MEQTTLTIALVFAQCIGEHPSIEIRRSTRKNAELLRDMFNNSTLLVSCQNQQIYYQGEIIRATIDNVTADTNPILNSGYDGPAKEICAGLSRVIHIANEEGYSNIIFVVDEHNRNEIPVLIGKIIGCQKHQPLDAGQILLFEPDVQQSSVINGNQINSTSFH